MRQQQLQLSFKTPAQNPQIAQNMMKQKPNGIINQNPINNSQKQQSSQQIPYQNLQFQQASSQLQQQQMTSINKSKLMSLTCLCEVERNSFPDLEIRKKDKNKVLQVFRFQGQKDGQLIDEIKIMIKYQKTMDIAIEFGLKEMKAVFSQNIQKGMIQFELKIDNKTLPKTANVGRNIAMSNSYGLDQNVKVFLSNMEVQLAQGLMKILQEEYVRVKQQKQQGQNAQKVDEEMKQQQLNNNETKKRKIEQISNPQQVMNNPRARVMKLTSQNVNNSQQNQVQTQVLQQNPKQITKPSIILRDLPWDLLRIILNYSDHNMLKGLKFVDKQFRKLVIQRKQKLTFNQKEIPEKIFFNILHNSTQISSLGMTTNFVKISPKTFQDNLIVLPKLQYLDLLNFSNINEVTLARIINSCRKNLQVFKIHYGAQGIGMNSMSTLARCQNLKDLSLGDMNEFYNQKILGGGSMGYERLQCIKRMIAERKFTLVKLVIYQCDQHILQSLSLKKESTSLVKLCIGQFVQKNTIKLDELEPLKKFKNLNWVNLCGTYHPLEFQIQLPDESNDQLLSVAGCRELELVFFSMKNNLRYLTIGQYAYDELLNFISEMCKSLEMLEINSDQITDQGLVPILRKLTQLRTLDIAACPLVTGICFYETEEFGISSLQRFITSVIGFEQQKIKEKLKEVAPSCQLELKLKKSFKLKN